MKIVLTSTNQAKKMAVNKVFSVRYAEVEIVTVEVDSNVSNTPLTDDEGIKGCINRIDAGKTQVPDGDVYIGLEGIISSNSYGSFLCGWCVIDFIKEQKRGIGCSAKVRLPDGIAEKVANDKELRELVKENYKSDLISEMSDIGSNGLFTNKAYTRVDEFEDAITCALGYAMNNSNFRESELVTE